MPRYSSVLACPSILRCQRTTVYLLICDWPRTAPFLRANLRVILRSCAGVDGFVRKATKTGLHTHSGIPQSTHLSFPDDELRIQSPLSIPLLQSGQSVRAVRARKTYVLHSPDRFATHV